jgi:hypothetical protein
MLNCFLGFSAHPKGLTHSLTHSRTHAYTPWVLHTGRYIHVRFIEVANTFACPEIQLQSKI